MLHLNVIREMVKEITNRFGYCCGTITLEEQAILTLFDKLGLNTDLVEGTTEKLKIVSCFYCNSARGLRTDKFIVVCASCESQQRG